MEQFIMKTKVYLGEASLETLRDMGIKKAFVICDPFMKSSHKVDMVTDLLEEAGAEFSVFAEVVPDPTIAVVTKAIEQMLVCRPDAVIALSHRYGKGGRPALFRHEPVGASGTDRDSDDERNGKRGYLLCCDLGPGKTGEISPGRRFHGAGYGAVGPAFYRFSTTPYYSGYRHGCADTCAGGVRFHRRR